MGDSIKKEEVKEITPEIQTKLEKFDKLESDNKELLTKHDNLNQGIAKYRDDAQKSSEKTKELEGKIQQLESRLDGEIDLNEGDIATFEKLVAKKGLVTREELDKMKGEQIASSQQELQNQAVTEFLKDHSEYDKDEEWSKVQKEFQQYRTPTNLQGYRNLLNKIHKELSTPDAEKRGGDKARAELTKKSRLSLGGGPQGGSEKEEQIEDLQKKYPNLSKEQIEERVSEINALHPEE